MVVAVRHVSRCPTGAGKRWDDQKISLKVGPGF